jgi:hypothetical protein
METSVPLNEALARFQEAFPDEAACEAYLRTRRWPEGFLCSCGGNRCWWLPSRASHECSDCGRQTSITAGTVMQRSNLGLMAWLSAFYLVGANPGELTARQLERALGLTQPSARRLHKKLERLADVAKDLANNGLFDGSVVVSHDEIQVRTGFNVTVFAALEENSGHIRLASAPDHLVESVEALIRENVKPGAILLTNREYPRLPDYQVVFLSHGERRLTNIRYILADADAWLNTFNITRRERVGDCLGEYEVYNNRKHPDRRLPFEALVDLALRLEPMSSWEIAGQDNPRKGRPTIRRHPRRRKTAAGMRQDRPRPPSASDLMPG